MNNYDPMGERVRPRFRPPVDPFPVIRNPFRDPKGWDVSDLIAFSHSQSALGQVVGIIGPGNFGGNFSTAGAGRVETAFSLFTTFNGSIGVPGLPVLSFTGIGGAQGAQSFFNALGPNNVRVTHNRNGTTTQTGSLTFLGGTKATVSVTVPGTGGSGSGGSVTITFTVVTGSSFSPRLRRTQKVVVHVVFPPEGGEGDGEGGDNDDEEEEQEQD